MKPNKKTIEPVIENVVVEEPVIEETEAVVEESPVVEPVFGVVSDCSKLNIRIAPSKDSNPVFVVEAGSELEIDMAASTDEWYSVCCANGVEGYCMKKFVTIK